MGNISSRNYKFLLLFSMLAGPLYTSDYTVFSFPHVVK